MGKLKEIPNSWTAKLIPEVLFFQEGPGVRNWQFTKEGVKLLNVGNINNQQLDLDATKVHLSNEEANEKYKHFLIDEGDLLIACSGIVVSNFHNKIAFAEKDHLPLCLNTSTMRFKSLNETINLNYFRYYLQTKHFTEQLQKLITGSAQLNFGPSHIKKIEVLVPPLNQQKKIAAILDAAAIYRQKTKALIAKYDELTQSLFLDMFGDPVRNPFKWELRSCGDFINYIADIGSNGANSVVSEKLEMSDSEDYAVMIRTTNLQRNDFINKIKYVSKEVYDFFKKSQVFGGEIIMNKIGSAGDFWIMPKLNKPVSLGLNQFVIRLADINLLYMYHFLSTDYGRVNIKSRCNGAATKSITKSAVRELPILYPPLNLQNQFAERVAAIETQKAQSQVSLEKAEELFASLLQRAFKGELV